MTYLFQLEQQVINFINVIFEFVVVCFFLNFNVLSNIYIDTIGIGGHFQTGGIGYLLRSHGAFTDYVIGFDIILSDGSSKLITPDNNYKNLFYAVRGGGPGSFGVVTNLYLKTENNNDYPNNAIGVQSIWLYTDQDARQIAKQWLILQNDLNYTQYDDFFPLFAIAPLFDGSGTQIILIAFIWINDVNGRSYNDFGKNYFMQPFLDSAINSPIIFSEIPGSISNLMNLFLNPSPKISPIPYTLRANGVTNSWNDEFIDILIDNISSIIDYSNNNNNNILVNLLFETYGGKFLSNDPLKSLSALPFRDLNMLLAIQLYYKTDNDKLYANEYLNKIFLNYISVYWNNEDIRVFGYTFGDLDMEIEKNNLNYYIDNNIFNSIKKIKKDVDECNIFRNTFTVPLPDNNQEFKEMNIYDLNSNDILMIKQWTNKFYYELDLFTSTTENNGNCTNLVKYIKENSIPDVRLTATGDISGIWNSRTEAIGLFCSLFGPYINEDHFQSGITFLSYLKRNKNNKCKFNPNEIVKIASKTFIYSIVTFEGNIRATFINRNIFTFIKYQDNKKWLLSEWDVDIERVDVANLG